VAVIVIMCVLSKLLLFILTSYEWLRPARCKQCARVRGRGASAALAAAETKNTTGSLVASSLFLVISIIILTY
jgi:hypothetical protein